MKTKRNKLVKYTSSGKPGSNGGRSTASSRELWTRRIKEYRLWSMGVIKSEIAAQFNITSATVAEDLKAVAMLEPIEDVKEKIDANLKEVIRTCFSKVNQAGIPENAKVGYIHEINEAASRIARIHGLERDNTNFFLNTNITNVSGENIYAKWDSDKLREEFKRRRLPVKPGNSAPGA